jgi:hypothetical protein
MTEGELEPTLPFTDGPFLLLAAPERFGFLPLNCTAILREWEALLDPIAAVRAAANSVVVHAFGAWVIEDRFVKPSYETGSLLRGVLRDEETIERLEASIVEYQPPDFPFERPWPSVGRLVSQGREAGNVRLQPLLLGQAICATILLESGYLSMVARALARARGCACRRRGRTSA